MAEENPPFVSSDSQESLPLSQESYVISLLNQLDCPITSGMTNVNDMEFPIAQELPFMGYTENLNHETISEHLGNLCASIAVPNMLTRQLNAPEQRFGPSSLPASVTWPGEYAFNVFFSVQESSKGVPWIYSALKNKLYVGKDVPCPVNFSTSVPMTDDVQIRAMPLFSSSDHASDMVRRCVNHSMNEITRGIFEAEHLVRCESSMARYEIDEVTGHHSVVVPFENPSAGQHFSTYIYKFLCYGSCSGGPNRRPLMLVFTLEKGYNIIGRYKLDLRICACPGRDMSNEDKNSGVQIHPNLPNKVQMKRKEPVTSSMQPTSSKKVRKQGPYCIQVKDRECYEFLKNVKKDYDKYKMLKENMSQNELKLLIYSSLSSSEDEMQS